MYNLHVLPMSEVEAQQCQSSSELIASLPAVSRGDEAPVEFYRLYKRRWLGVFAMVCTTFFRKGLLHVDMPS